MTEQDVIGMVDQVLNDTSRVRWTEQFLRDALNEGVQAVIAIRPDAYSQNTTVTLVEGTRQTLPAGGLRLLDVTRNVKADNTPGKVINYIDRALLDNQEPNWHAATKATSVKHVMYDDRDPKTFYVYPPAKAGIKIDIVHSALPTPSTQATDNLGLDDIYKPALVEYVLYRAYSIPVEFNKNPQLSAAKFAAFGTMLGTKTKVDTGNSPDLNTKGAVPRTAAISMGAV